MELRLGQTKGDQRTGDTESSCRTARDDLIDPLLMIKETMPILIRLIEIAFLGWLVAAASASDILQEDSTSNVEQESSMDGVQQGGANTPPQTKPQRSSDEKRDQNNGKEKTKHGGAFRGGSFVIAPLPIVSPAIGAGIVPVSGYIFSLEEGKANPQPSVIGAGGLVTNNGSRGFGLGGDLYLDQARYELKAGYARGNLNYNLYGVGFDAGNQGLKLPLEQAGQAFFLKFLRNVGWDIYLGGRFMSGNSLVTLRLASSPIPIPPDVGLSTNLRAVGIEAYRDSRKNRFYPIQGSVIDITADFFAQGLGSKYSFQAYRFTFNKYISLSSKQVLAYNSYLCGTSGEPPFYGNCIYGMNEELRGYTAGRYLDRFMFATQLEYRLVLPWRIGVVGFGGIGAVAPGVNKWRNDQLLPAGGTGVRFMLSKKYHVNLRTDFAWGKDNFTWAVGVGEAF